jgi:hypothetical protein
MVTEPHDWTVPAPLRALLWWPPVAFFLVLLEPTAAAGTIAITGAALAVLGVAGAAVGRAINRRGTASDEPVTAVTIPERAVPPAVEQQAA